jgi:hypothetical protein
MSKRFLTIFLLGLFPLMSYAAWDPVAIGSADEVTDRMIFLNDKKTGYSLTHQDTDYFPMIYTDYHTYHLYQTLDSGSTWSEVTLKDIQLENDWEKYIDLVVDDSGILYELRVDGEQAKVYSSSDGGKNWRQLGGDIVGPIKYLLTDHKNNLFAVLKKEKQFEVDQWNTEKQQWDPFYSFDSSLPYARGVFDKDNNLYFAGPAKIIYKITPEKIKTDISVSSLVKGELYSFMIDDKTNYFYLGTRFSGNIDDDNGLYKSMDQGNSWTLISDGITHDEGCWSRSNVYDSLLLNSQGVLYVMSNDYDCLNMGSELGSQPIDHYLIWSLAKNTNDQNSGWHNISDNLNVVNVYHKLFLDKNDHLYVTGSTGTFRYSED